MGAWGEVLVNFIWSGLSELTEGLIHGPWVYKISVASGNLMANW